MNVLKAFLVFLIFQSYALASSKAEALNPECGRLFGSPFNPPDFEFRSRKTPDANLADEWRMSTEVLTFKNEDRQANENDRDEIFMSQLRFLRGALAFVDSGVIPFTQESFSKLMANLSLVESNLLLNQKGTPSFYNSEQLKIIEANLNELKSMIARYHLVEVVATASPRQSQELKQSLPIEIGRKMDQISMKFLTVKLALNELQNFDRLYSGDIGRDYKEIPSRIKALTSLNKATGLFLQTLEEVRKIPGVETYDLGPINSLIFQFKLMINDRLIKNAIDRLSKGQNDYRLKVVSDFKKTIARSNEVFSFFEDKHPALLLKYSQIFTIAEINNFRSVVENTIAQDSTSDSLIRKIEDQFDDFLRIASSENLRVELDATTIQGGLETCSQAEKMIKLKYLALGNGSTANQVVSVDRKEAKLTLIKIKMAQDFLQSLLTAVVNQSSY